MLGTLKIALACFAIIAATSLEAQAVQTPAEGKVEVFVIKVAFDKATKEQERRFIDELRLALDTIEVEVIEAPTSQFRNDTLGNQILWVKSALESRKALAGIWLSPASFDLLLLHMVID